MRKINKDKIDKLIKEALNLKQNGDIISAELNLNEVLKFEPENLIALNNLGNINSLRNDLKTAKIFLSKAINIKNDYTNAIFNLALVNEEMGSKEEAINLGRCRESNKSKTLCCVKN